MLDEIKRWYRENSIPVMALFFVSAAVGIILAIACFFFPPVLAAVAAMTLGGSTPFAFLLSLSVSLAAPLVGLISIGMTWAISTLSWLITHQLCTIAKAVYVLFAPQEDTASPSLTRSSYEYLSDHLQKRMAPRPYEEEGEDDDLEMSAERPLAAIGDEEEAPELIEEQSSFSLQS